MERGHRWLLGGRSSATAAVGLVGGVGRQCDGYRLFSRLGGAMTAHHLGLLPDPTLNGPLSLGRSDGSLLSGADVHGAR